MLPGVEGIPGRRRTQSGLEKGFSPFRKLLLDPLCAILEQANRPDVIALQIPAEVGPVDERRRKGIPLALDAALPRLRRSVLERCRGCDPALLLEGPDFGIDEREDKLRDCPSVRYLVLLVFG